MTVTYKLFGRMFFFEFWRENKLIRKFNRIKSIGLVLWMFLRGNKCYCFIFGECYRNVANHLQNSFKLMLIYTNEHMTCLFYLSISRRQLQFRQMVFFSIEKLEPLNRRSISKKSLSITLFAVSKWNIHLCLWFDGSKFVDNSKCRMDFLIHIKSHHQMIRE